MSWRDHFLFWLDSQISVESLFWSDLKWLLWLPALPFMIATMIWWDTDTSVRSFLVGTGLLLCVPWGFLIFHRRRIKKEKWIEQTRFSDKTNGY